MQEAVESKEQQIKEANNKKKVVKSDGEPPASTTHLQAESTLDQENEVELENDPNHVLKEKLHRGIDNPADKIENYIQSKMNPVVIEGVNDHTKLTNSPHKNFETIYDSMFHGDTETKFSTIDDERIKMGSNLKAMGRMSHKGANDDVKKQGTRMGNIKDVQLDQGEINMGTEQEAIDKSNENKELLKKIDIQGMF